MVRKKDWDFQIYALDHTRAQDILMRMLEEGLALVPVESMDPELLGSPKPKGMRVILIPYSITRSPRVRAA